MNQIICGIIKSIHPLSVKQQLFERLRLTYLETPCLITVPITERTCYSIINYVRELTSTNIDNDTLKFCRLCLECCHIHDCLYLIAEHLINDSHINLSISFVQLLSDRLPIEISRPFLERAFFERHELNNEALHFILLSITKNRQLTSGQRTIFYIKLIELVLFRLHTLDHSIEQVEFFCKQLSLTIEELCYENNQKSIHLLNDIVNGVTSGLLTCLADTTKQPSTALANIIDLLQECPNENLLDSFILTIDDDRLILCLNRLAQSFRWPCSTTKPSQWLVSIWKLLFTREREMLVEQSASSSIIPDLISMLGNPSCYQNVIPALCWIFVNQPFHLQTFATSLQNEILQLVLNNPNFLRDNLEMNNLVESVRYGLKYLLNTEENLQNHDLLNNLLQNLPKSNAIYAKNIQLMKCKSSSSSSSVIENNFNEPTVRLHDKIGLINIGNTCYLNAIMQALYACTKFRQCVLNYDTLLSNNNELLKSLQNLFAFMTLSQRPCYRPERFWLQAKPSYFERHQQQDCQEFLRHLLDNLHEDAKRTIQNELNHDFVKEHLMGTCIHSSKCLTCSSMTNSEDLFYDLSIGFNDQLSINTTEQTKIFDLQLLIDHTFAWESLTNENQFACEKCQTKQDGSRRMYLTSYPNYLIILLKRFVHNRLTDKYEKCLDRTTLPEYIQLLTANENFFSYRLKSIVVHHGLSMNSGHYYAFVMLNNENNSNNDWWLFNDTHVEHLTFENVCQHFQRFQSATPYVLIFEKQIQEQEIDTTQLPILPYLQTIVDRDNQLYAQEQKRHGRLSRSADVSDVTEPYLRNTGCKDQSPDRGPPCIF